MLDFTGKVRIVVVVGGRLSVRINGQLHTLGRGDFFVVTPLFIYEDLEGSDDLQTESLRIDLHSFLEQMKHHLQISLILFIFNHPVNHPEDSDLQYYIGNLEAINRQRQQATSEEIPEPLREILLHTVAHSTESLLLSIISGNLLRNHEEIFSKSSDQEFKKLLVSQFLLTVNQNFHRERSVAFYAARAKLSAAHLSTLIRQKTGRSPMYWITFITINNAKALLRDNTLNIKQIAHRLGFPEQFTFRKYFKSATGMSSTEFKESKP